jgi:L-malate glycosyltransferase
MRIIFDRLIRKKVTTEDTPELTNNINYSDLAAAIHLPFISESLSYRPYLDTIKSISLLELFINVIYASYPTINLYVLFSNDEIADNLFNIVKKHVHVIPFRTTYRTQIRAFAHLAKEAGKPHIAFLPLGIVFAPEDLLSRVYTHHVKYSNNFTKVTGFPENSTPEIYDSYILRYLCDLQHRFLPSASTPKLAIEQLSSITRVENRTSSTTTPVRFLSFIARALNRRLTPIRSQPFNAAKAYQASPAKLPESIRLNTPADIELASEILSRIPSSQNENYGLDLLYWWKRVTLEKRSQLQNKLMSTVLPDNDKSTRLKSVRVLYVSNPSAFSGAEESICQLIAHTDHNRFEPFALVGSRGVFTERLQQSGATVICPEQDFGRGTVENFLYLLTTFRRIQPNIVHFNSNSGMAALFAAKLLNIPIVQHLRVAELDAYGEQLRNADAIIAISEFVKQQTVRFDIPESKVHVVFNGVDLDRFHRASFDKYSLRKDLGLPLNAKVVLMIARFTPKKRHDLIIKAAEIMKRSINSLHIVLVGESYIASEYEYYEAIQRQVQSAGLTNNVTFLGFQRDIRRVEAAADLLVLCSDREPLGRSVIESLAIELPVIVTDSGGSKELVKNGITGFIVPSGDAAELAAKMIDILTDEDLYNRLIQAGRKYAESELSAVVYAKKVMDIYDSVLAERHTYQEISRPTDILPVDV